MPGRWSTSVNTTAVGTDLPSRPTVHTTHDQLVPARDVSYYRVLTGIAGTQDLFVAKFVDARGHCTISPAQTGAAFDALLAWVREHKRPAAGEQR